MKYTEIFKLKKMLEENNISFDYIDNSLSRGSQHHQICVPRFDLKKRVISVIQGAGTYGGQDDLLEIMGLMTEEEEENDRVVGWLSAENVFERIKKYIKENEQC